MVVFLQSCRGFLVLVGEGELWSNGESVWSMDIGIGWLAWICSQLFPLVRLSPPLSPLSISLSAPLGLSPIP